MILYQILYSLFCIGFADMNFIWIKTGKKIYHFWNGVIHLLAAIGGLTFFNWQTAVAILFVARLFFDWSLNLMRGLPLGYVSPSPKSKVDIIEKKIFGLDGITPKLLYLAIVIILNLI